MSRYARHRSRHITRLDGLWDFTFLGAIEPDAAGPTALEFAGVQAVPGCWDASPDLAGCRGLAAYRRVFTTRDPVRHRLVFEGVNHWCRVLVDGQALADHAGGFTRFAVDVGDPAPGPHELVVLVDNRDLPERCPTHRDAFDWYPWGGLTRSVALHRLGHAWLDTVEVTTRSLDPPEVGLTISWSATGPATLPLRVHCDDSVLLDDELAVTDGSGALEVSVGVPGGAPWSPATPNLHLLGVTLGEDDLWVRTGLRFVDTEGGFLRVNGEPVRLIGVSRHEFHPDFGAALPDHVVAADVSLLRELGVACVRGAHYPQDPRFLDLCDEAGLLVWSEATGWQQGADALTDEHYLTASERTIDEMIAAARNHPSVVLWGLLNEGRSDDPACRPGYERLVGRIRALDPTRPVTYASNHITDDRMLDLVDVVSVNDYTGWYHGDVADIPDAYDRVLAAVDAAGHGAKPVVFAEFGAEGIAGLRDRAAERWTEDGQARHLDVALRHLLETRDDRVAGALVWVFSDFRTSSEMPRLLVRPAGYNHKGVVDARRGPKLATAVVRRWFRGVE